VKNLPYVTIVILVVAYIISDLGFIALPLSFAGYDPWMLVHPFLHINKMQLFENGVMFFMVGALIESWMILRHRYRYLILVLCYFSILVAANVRTMLSGQSSSFGVITLELAGLSGMVSAGLAFLLVYSMLYRKRVRFDGVSAFVPVGILLFLGFTPLLYSPAIYVSHNLLVFSVSLALAVVVLTTLQKRTLLLSYDEPKAR